jgi:putative FmdB family regulatory protein
MPTYEYKCDACGTEFEKFQSISAPSIRKCPKCGKRKVRRLISAGAGLIFKGGGFYETDYRSDAYKKDAKSDSAPVAETKPADGKPVEKKADAKPAESKPAAEASPKSKSSKTSKTASSSEK